MFPFSGRIWVARGAHRRPLGLVMRSEPSAVGFKAAFRAASGLLPPISQTGAAFCARADAPLARNPGPLA